MADPKERKTIVNLPENVLVDYTFERMLKSFTRQVEKTGVLQEVRARRYYTKPSEVKRLAKKSKKRRNQ